MSMVGRAVGVVRALLLLLLVLLELRLLLVLGRLLVTGLLLLLLVLLETVHHHAAVRGTDEVGIRRTLVVVAIRLVGLWLAVGLRLWFLLLLLHVQHGSREMRRWHHVGIFTMDFDQIVVVCAIVVVIISH
jgi:hypothetical protein